MSKEGKINRAGEAKSQRYLSPLHLKRGFCEETLQTIRFP